MLKKLQLTCLLSILFFGGIDVGLYAQISPDSTSVKIQSQDGINVRGLIKDAKTGKGISGISIAIENFSAAITNEDGTFSPNTTNITAEQYWTAIGQRTPIAEPFIYDATNIRLRELVLGYAMPQRLLENSPFRSVNISLVGRNLFFILNEAEFFDPEQGAGTGNLQGIESFNIPSTRNYGMSVKFGF